MLFPDPENLETATCFVIIDFARPISDIHITDKDIIPVYPVVGDTVFVQGDTDEIWHTHIMTVDSHMQSCQVHFYIPGRTLDT